MSILAKLQCEFKHEYQTLLWLHSYKNNANWSLYCKVCQEFMITFKACGTYMHLGWLVLPITKTNNILDYTKSEQHVPSMVHLKVECQSSRHTHFIVRTYYTFANVAEQSQERANDTQIWNLLCTSIEGFSFSKIPSVSCSSWTSGSWVRLLL